MRGVTFNSDNKYDIQLSDALINERRLGEIFAAKKIEKSELKSETYQWERTGNICVEVRSYGKKSGLAATEADYWVHELKRDGETLVYLMFPVDRLKSLCRTHGRLVHDGGDNNAQSNYLIKLSDILA